MDSFLIKSSVPKGEYWSSAGTLRQLEEISNTLTGPMASAKGFSPAMASPRALAELAHACEHWMDRWCGVRSPVPRRMRRISGELFAQMKRGGALETILGFTIRWQLTNGPLNFTSEKEDDYRKCLVLFSAIQKGLVKKGLISEKRVFLHDSIPTSKKEEYKTQLEKQWGIAVTSMAGATHVIYSDCVASIDGKLKPRRRVCAQTIDTPKGKLRVVGVDQMNRRLKVHWLAHPSSFDEWLSTDVFIPTFGSSALSNWKPASSSRTTTTVKMMYLTEKFIVDCQHYNEWMDEADYEVIAEDSGADSSCTPIPRVAATVGAVLVSKRKTSAAVRPSVNHRLNGTAVVNHSSAVSGKKRKADFSDSSATQHTAKRIKLKLKSKKKKAPAISGGANGSVPQLTRSRSSIQDNIRAKLRLSKPSKTVIQDISIPTTAPPMQKAQSSIQLKSSKSSKSKSKRKRLRLSTTGSRHTSESPTPLQSSSLEAAGVGKRKSGKSSKKRFADTGTTVAQRIDQFPYSGPSLTTVRPAAPAYPVVIPTYARWFRLDRIHATECQHLASLFSHKPLEFHSRYLEIRNFIVNCYRLNPRVYLTATAVRRMVAADAGAVLRIHSFLEEWGLINYSVDTGSVPQSQLPLVDFTHVDTPFGIKPAFECQWQGSAVQPAESSSSTSERKQQPLFDAGKEAIDFVPTDKNRRKNGMLQKPKRCVMCGVECTRVYYALTADGSEELKEESSEECFGGSGMTVCGDCFHNDSFPSVFSQSDFELVEPMAHASDGREKESASATSISSVEGKCAKVSPMRLLTTLNESDGNWQKAAAKLGNSAEELISQFVSMPLSVDANIGTADAKSTASSSLRRSSQQQSAAFSWESSTVTESSRTHALLPFSSGTGVRVPSILADACHPVLAQCAALYRTVPADLVETARSAALAHLENVHKSEGVAIAAGDWVAYKERGEGTRHRRGCVQSVDSKKFSLTVKTKRLVKPAAADSSSSLAAMDSTESELRKADASSSGGAVIREELESIAMSDVLNVYNSETSTSARAFKWLPCDPSQTQEKALAAAVLGGSSAVARALQASTQRNIEELLSQLVLVQSEKVRLKMEHLNELWAVLRMEYEHMEEAKLQLLRERVRVGRQRLQANSALASASVAGSAQH